MNFNVTFTEDALTVAWKSTRKCGYLQIDEDGWGYVRVDLRPDALQTKQELPSSLEAINEMNAWVKSL